MYGFIRSHRYHPGGTHVVQEDLAQAMFMDRDAQASEVMLIVTDNGGAYSLDIAASYHLYGRIFRTTQKASLSALLLSINST